MLNNVYLELTYKDLRDMFFRLGNADVFLHRRGNKVPCMCCQHLADYGKSFFKDGKKADTIKAFYDENTHDSVKLLRTIYQTSSYAPSWNTSIGYTQNKETKIIFIRWQGFKLEEMQDIVSKINKELRPYWWEIRPPKSYQDPLELQILPYIH